jgi:nucleoside-diphosphate-sugar epimerase
MRVLVVGGTGFLGPPVVAKLSNLGSQVTVFHRGDHEAPLPYGVEHVHAPEAAPPIVRFPPELTALAWDVVLATALFGEADAAAIMRTFRGVARRVVALSSGDVYRAYGVLSGTEPGSPQPQPLSEDSPLRESLYPYRNATGVPESLRDYEKILVERAILSDPDLPGTILRLPAVYGPGDRHQRLTSVWRRIADARPVIVVGRSYGQWRWTHGFVEDVADAVVLAVLRERAKGRVYNVGEEPTPTTEERIEAFGRASGWTGRVAVVPDHRVPPHFSGGPQRDVTLNFGQNLVYDTSRIRRELDWAEVTAPEEAYRRTAEWESRVLGASARPSEEEYAAEERAAGAP